MMMMMMSVRVRHINLVQSRFAETPTLTKTINPNPNPNFGESGFGESGRHHKFQHGLTHRRHSFTKQCTAQNSSVLWVICDCRRYVDVISRCGVTFSI